MKKLLLSLATVAAGLFTANAATVTFDFASDSYGLPADASTYATLPATLTNEDVTITLTGNTNAWRYWNDGLREYRNNAPKMTVSAPSDNVLTKVVFTVNSGVKITVSGSSESLTTWTGSSADVTFDFSTSTGNAAITKMEITYDEGEGGDTGGGDEPVTPPAGEEATATFDFVNNSYGLPNNSDTYVTIPTTISEGVVEMTLTGNTNAWRYWSDGLREYNKNAPKFTLSLTNGGTITKVVITAKSGAVFKLEGTSDAITTWEGSATSLTFDGSSSTGNAAITAINVTYVGGGTVTVSAPKISCENNQVSITCATPDAKIYYTTDGTNPSNTSTEYTAPFAITKNTTVKAIAYLGSDASTITSYDATFTVSGVITVEQALALIENGYNSTATVKGYITEIQEISTSYGNATYFIADEKGGAPTLEVYRGYWMNGEKFTTGNEIEIDGLVTVEGTLVNYNGTYEFTTGNKVVAYEAPSTSDEPVDYEAPFADQTYTIGVGEVWTLPLGSAHPATADFLIDANTGSEFVEINKEALTIKGVAAGTAEILVVWGASAKYNEGQATFTITVEEADFTTAAVTYDFIKNDYGMTRLSGTTSEYNPDPFTVEQDKCPIEILLNGKTRLWSDGLRFYKESSFKVLSDNEYIKITGITINYNNATAANAFVFADNQSGEYTLAGAEGTWSGNALEIGFNSNIASGNQAISTIKVNYIIPTAVEGIDADNDATPVYYNLQGVRVNNPEKGIYIVVKGNKASKVIF